ncbi:ABC transporter permease [Actinacidiphila bryophytorum]|uniref:ABC-2 type transport system permease protein n=1 Tax=Actinacidiphila bryophytorum TaxID=1436133 RepID=A0A9W4H4B5_9ACTN|nr:ABC transporter permease [Actinacidiphila bryophytorum]MBM9435759.1 ABC transporter permease [Actinacidiphila bryophytorum]MBN6541603.1 ABC transporter permease [Actinacidiphila bryophytorum]CAG7650372.1 ABC-2 type transport system permease protein [Actinacidiphila bryophytorum]
MTVALHAEWTKFRTLTSPLWLLLGAVAVTVALSAVATSAVSCTTADCGSDPTRISLVGVDLGQALVAILGVLGVSNEYGTGVIRTSLTAIPRRVTVLAAKCVVLSGAAAVGGTAAVLGALLTGRIVLPDLSGRALSLSDGPTLRAVFGSVLYLVLIGLLSLGIATAVRDSATGIGVVLGLLYIFPIVAGTISDPHLRLLLEKIAPMSAGLAIQATTDLPSLPISPWAGLGVTAGWAAAALLVGGLLLCRRDA